MKNTKKIVGIIALAAVIVVSGLAFTGCPVDDTEKEYIFSNSSTYKIEVICQGKNVDPKSFTLSSPTVGAPPVKQIVKVTGTLSYGWNIESEDKTTSATFVLAKQTGTGILFTDK